MTLPVRNQILGSKPTMGGIRCRAKILEIGPYPPPYGGWSMRIWVVRNALESAGHVCAVLNLGQSRKVPSAEYECVRTGWEYFRKLAFYAWRGYTYHIHTNGESLKGFVLNLAAYVVSLLAFRRPVLTFHAGTDQVFFPREKSRLTAPLFKFLFGVAKAVICNNPDVARKIIEYGISSRKVFPISPFTKEYVNFRPQPVGDELNEFLDTFSPTILTYVECRPEYDLQSVFNVVGQLARQRRGLGMIVVGASRERTTISELARSAGLTDRCLHLGTVGHGVFLSLLRRVTVYLRCSRTEGTSASIREALHFGTPVVANNSQGQPVGVVVYPWGDALAMREALEAVLSGTGTAGPLGERRALVGLPDTVGTEVELLVRCAIT